LRGDRSGRWTRGRLFELLDRLRSRLVVRPEPPGKTTIIEWLGIEKVAQSSGVPVQPLGGYAGRMPSSTCSRWRERGQARARRKAIGISQMELALRIRMHFTFVSEVERGGRSLSLSSLLWLAEGLGVNPGEPVDGLTWE